MRTFFSKQTSVTLALLLFIGIWGCKTTTDSNSNPTTTTVHPGVGSTYAYHSTTTDSTGTTTDSHDYTMTVVSVNQTIGGKTGVTTMTSSNDTTTSALVFQSNGDVLLWVPIEGIMGGSGNLWMTLPFSGGAGSNATIVDTTMDFFGTTMHLKISFATSYVGTESITTAGKTFAAKKVKQTVTTQQTLAGITTTSASDSYLWFAPEIGGMIKSENVASRDSYGQMSDASMDLLTSYSLK